MDENNNRGDDPPSPPIIPINVEELIVANQIATTSNLRDSNGPGQGDPNFDVKTKSCPTSDADYRTVKPAGGILVLPPHYVQLAAALGLNTQSMLEPNITRPDFERTIEVNHQRRPRTPDTSTRAVEGMSRSNQSETARSSQNELRVEARNERQPLVAQDNLCTSMDVGYTLEQERSNSGEATRDGSYQNNTALHNVSQITRSSNSPELPKVTDAKCHFEKSCEREQNQNNQNFLNQQEQSYLRPCSTDDMWRPW